MRRNLAALRRLAFSSFLVSCLLACGSRTGLFGEDDENGIGITPNPFDSGTTFPPGNLDGSIDFPDGGTIVPDDAPSTIDARPVRPDVFRADCPDSNALLVYVISGQNELLSFDPGSGQFKTISPDIKCPAAPGETPFSMAVDRRGTAYVLFTDENLYRVSTATGACIATSYVPRQSNFARFGMGFATNTSGLNEKLFVIGDPFNVGTGQPEGAQGLASIDPTSFKLDFVGADPTLAQAELTGTGDGRLFAFYRQDRNDTTSYIGELDTETGALLGTRHFESVEQGNGWAFSFWGGDFYMFHSPGDDDFTTVTRWRPSDNSVATVARTQPGTTIVGAGVSTCAPQN